MDRFTEDGRETLVGAEKIWETEITSRTGKHVRVRRVGTHVMKSKSSWYNPSAADRDGVMTAREAFVDYRVSVDGRLVNSFLTKPQALRFAKAL